MDCIVHGVTTEQLSHVFTCCLVSGITVHEEGAMDSTSLGNSQIINIKEALDLDI